MQKGLRLITQFTACRYLYPVQRYLRSKSKAVVKRTKFRTFFALPNFEGAVSPKVVDGLSPHLAARHVEKFYKATHLGSRDLDPNTLNSKPILDPLKCKGDPRPQWGCASKTLSFSSMCKNFGDQHPLGAEIWSSEKSRFGWVWFHIEISVISGPKFTGLFSPNAGGIAVDDALSRYWIYIHPFRRHSPLKFEVDRNGAKFCMFLTPKVFWGDLSTFWTRIIKLNILPIIVQNFAAIGRRSSEISRGKKENKC